MDYHALRHIADTWGLLVLFLFFVGVVIWAFRPGAKAQQDAAARIPLEDEDEE